MNDAMYAYTAVATQPCMDSEEAMSFMNNNKSAIPAATIRDNKQAQNSHVADLAGSCVLPDLGK